MKDKSYNVTRLDDNTKGIDLLAECNGEKFAIECKFHKGFSWNELVKIYNKTATTVNKTLDGQGYIPVVIFKSNQQPPLIMWKFYFDGQVPEFAIQLFTDRMQVGFDNIPKGYKVWH